MNKVFKKITACTLVGVILSIMVYTFNSYKEDSYAAIGKAA